MAYRFLNRTISASILLLFTAFFIIFGFSCSSAPKRPAAVFTDRNIAANQLTMANKAANQGRFTEALQLLEEARRLAVATDDPPLLIRTSIARGNFLFSLGHHEEAFSHWEAARLEAQRSGDNNLAVLAQIYTERGRLVLLDDSAGNTNAIEEIRNNVNSLTSSIRSDPASQAAGFLVIGMAEKELGRYAEAERSVRQALALHERNLYLEEIAYNWFFLASVYSVSGRYNDALAALETAIEFDRRAENGFGLASSWQAMGEVYQKAGNSALSLRAFARAAGIFRAIGLEDSAIIAETRAAGL